MTIDWPLVELGSVCEFKYGKALAAGLRDGGKYDVYGSNGKVGSHSLALSNGPTIVVGRKGSFGEIVYSADRCWPIDTTYFVDSSCTKADLKWLSYRLTGLGLNTLNRAAAIPGLNRDDAYRQRMLLPPTEEQRRIAAILDQADALRVKRRQTLALFDDLTQSIFLDMFGAADLGVRLGDIADFKYGTSNKSQAEGELTLRIPNVGRGAIHTSDLRKVPVSADELDRLRLGVGDVLFVRTNGNPDEVGRCAAFDPSSIAGSGHDPERVIYASYLIRARVHGAAADPTFLVAFLTTGEGRKQLRANSKTSAGQYNINIEGLSSVRVPAVPLHAQCSFARKVVQVRDARRDVNQNAQLTEQLFTSLQERAFAGRL